jgi:hypothetical protein
MEKKKAVKKADPKYIGVPNVCFSLVDKDGQREKAYVKQRLTVGFDDSETWSLDTVMARFTPHYSDYLELDKILSAC